MKCRICSFWNKIWAWKQGEGSFTVLLEAFLEVQWIEGLVFGGKVIAFKVGWVWLIFHFILHRILLPFFHIINFVFAIVGITFGNHGKILLSLLLEYPSSKDIHWLGTLYSFSCFSSQPTVSFQDKIVFCTARPFFKIIFSNISCFKTKEWLATAQCCMLSLPSFNFKIL